MNNWGTDREVEKVKTPVRRRPPIVGVPPARPRCQWCDKPLKAWFNETPEARVFARWQGYYGKVENTPPLFDTLSCARLFAGAAHAAGYRRQR